MGWWDKIWTDKSEDWVSGWLSEGQAPAGALSGEIQEDTAYLNVFLRSARIVNVRQGLTKLYGAVHSYMRVPHRSQQASAEFNVFTTPSALKNVDSKNLDRVIHDRERLLGPVPYPGGDFEMEVGLFSIAAADLAAPYLSLLETLSKTAGVSFLSVALPFAGPILEGVKLLTGNNKDCLEIGLSGKYPRPRQGYYVAMRAPKEQIPLSSLRLDPSDCHLLDSDGRAIAEYPYIVLEVRAESQRDDWFKIPELAKAYSRVQEYYREDRKKETEAALYTFRRVALTCNDLTSADAIRIADKAESIYKTVGPLKSERSATAAAGAPGGPSACRRTLPDLSQLVLPG